MIKDQQSNFRNGSKTGDDQQYVGNKGMMGWGQFLGSRFNFVDRTEKIQFSRGQFHTLIPFS